MKIARMLFLLMFLILQGCPRHAEKSPAAYSQQAAPWRNLNFHKPSGNIQFAVIADRFGKNRPGVYENAIAELDLLKPQFVITIGDSIEGTGGPEQLNRQWDEFKNIISKLNMPFFYLPGNHDISEPAARQVWNQRFGKTYYHFIHNNTLFLCLDTEDFADQQLAYFQKVLPENTGVHWTMIFMHKPLWKQKGPNKKNWEKFESLLAKRPYTVFAGHTHRYEKSVRNGRNYYILATTGATPNFKSGKETIFDHIVWVTMTDKGPIIANLTPQKIYDDDPFNQTNLKTKDLTDKNLLEK